MFFNFSDTPDVLSYWTNRYCELNTKRDGKLSSECAVLHATVVTFTPATYALPTDGLSLLNNGTKIMPISGTIFS